MKLSPESLEIGQNKRMELMRFLVCRILRNPRSPEKWQRTLGRISAAVGLVTPEGIRLFAENPQHPIAYRMNKVTTFINSYEPLGEEASWRGLLEEIAKSPLEYEKWEAWAGREFVKLANPRRYIADFVREQNPVMN